MRSLIVCSVLAVSAALAQVSSSNFGGNIWVSSNDDVLMCGKCTRDGSSSSTSPRYYQLDCDATLTSNVVGKLRAACTSSDCTASSCSETDVSVELGHRVYSGFEFWSSTITSNTSSAAAIAASIQCCGAMLKYESWSGTSCSGTSAGVTYEPAGCTIPFGTTSSYSRYNCAGESAETWLSCTDDSTNKKTFDACTSSTGCTGLAIKNSPCATYEVSGFSFQISTTRTITCTNDGTQRCVRVVRGSTYDAAVDTPTAAVSTLSCTATSGSAAVSALVAVVAALALLF